MNQNISSLFQELVTVLSHDTTNPRADVLAADIAARVASSNSVCVDARPIRNEGFVWIQGGIRKFLHLHGVVIRSKEAAGYRWLFIQPDREEKPHEFAGNKVLERFLDGQVAA
jgi:hypothetical protein